MRRFLFRLFQVALLFVASILVGLAIIALSTNLTLKPELKSMGHQTHWGNSWERISEFEKWAKTPSKQPRGLIIGSSTAYRNINPYVLDAATKLNWFNYGSSGQPPALSLLLLKHAFAQCPLDYVLLDIYGPVVQLEGLESAHDLIYNSKLDWWNKTKMLCRFPEGKLWLRYAYFYAKQVLPTKDFMVTEPNNGGYMGKGFVCSNQPALKHYRKAPKTQKIPSFPELAQIAALCKANGARLILHISPSLEGPFLLPASFKKYPLIQINNFKQPTHFYDTHHMTCEGANLFSDELGMKLKSILY